MTKIKGPIISLSVKCLNCVYCNSEEYSVQGDSGIDVYCTHPDFESKKYIGDTKWDTPTFCPYLKSVKYSDLQDLILKA